MIAPIAQLGSTRVSNERPWKNSRPLAQNDCATEVGCTLGWASRGTTALLSLRGGFLPTLTTTTSAIACETPGSAFRYDTANGIISSNGVDHFGSEGQAMKFVVLLPTTDNDGKAFRQSKLIDLIDRFNEAFGGSSVEGPVYGSWKNGRGELMRDTLL